MSRRAHFVDRKVMGGHGRSREATGGHGRPREVTGGHGRSREVTGGRAHLVDHRPRVRVARRVREHRDARVDAEGARRARRRERNLCELLGVRVDVDRAVAVHVHLVCEARGEGGAVGGEGAIRGQPGLRQLNQKQS